MSQSNVKYQSSCTSKSIVVSFIELLKIPDNELVWLALRYFDLLLARASDGYETFLQCDGPSYLEALEFHENTDIRNKAIELLETYYEKDDNGHVEEDAQEEPVW